MASSKTTTTKKNATKTKQDATVPDGSPSGQTKRKPIATRRAPVQYTPSIPTARCPGC